MGLRLSASGAFSTQCLVQPAGRVVVRREGDQLGWGAADGWDNVAGGDVLVFCCPVVWVKGVGRENREI